MLKYRLLGSALLISVSCIPVGIAPSNAQVTFRPPRILAPRESTGGASRDGNSCLSAHTETQQASVTPVIPLNRIGFTVKERPTILVYIPQTSARKALFSLQDEQANNHYQTTIALPAKPGVMAIKLSEYVPALQTGKNYQWSLSMICSAELEPDSPLVNGWVQRVHPPVNVKNSGHLSPSLELVSHLANNGLWYDTASVLAQLKQAQPHNPTISISWQQLLNSVGLNAIANEPLIN
ncbi:DUF928 domain-containing protein [Tolypothrix sp. FACHB-123]|uniref:DUF928 domain-containing protein n=1 Tax=Tolypothrix sp. FACHB-123 TaxID=2692868 RepID=UPI0016850D25|nr:DUF928 domain-containing protein [Tolypothrix sp. FACHB-123]MBD2358620.1 DUF928 domain-containing protein [Tolypothrix sp. FACHB-123]